MPRNVFSWSLSGTAIAVLAISVATLASAQVTSRTVAMDSDDIAGVVSGPDGPEAGVWVIAETRDLPTRHIKIVVTDEAGRYLIPDLPQATYDLWVRGYGLVDSDKIKAEPGDTLDLTAAVAANARAAAEYYPALNWFALLELPPPSEFPGTGPGGNGISPDIKSQGEWIRSVINTDGCTGCHALGNKATREIPDALGDFDSHIAAWDRRVQSGQAGGAMDARLARAGRESALKMYADWTDRIQAGEYPMTAPPRPQGIERNVVVSLWDWSAPEAYMHDLISADKRNPRINANGPVYGAPENSTDSMPVVNPTTHVATTVPLEVRDPRTPSSASTPPKMPSPYWGDEVIWESRTLAHSFAMDKRERVWIAARVRPAETPDFCKEGSSHPSAQAFPIGRSNRQMQLWDPKTQQMTTVDTCFGTHHLNFDEDDKLWFTGSGPVVAWFDTKVFDETGDEKLAQGWTVQVLDTNGNDRRDAYVEPGAPLDPTKDTRIERGYYGVAPSPLDGSIWGSTLGMPGGLVRFVPGDDPVNTALVEFFEVPWNDPAAPVQGFSPRGMDVDSNGVVWTVLSSGHFASFDRSQCEGPLNGPSATGRHCQEGWTLYPFPGPNYKGATDSGSAESAYYNFTDRFNLLGVGENIPLATGNLSEGVLALVDGQFYNFRVPYPLGSFFGKGLDGRIDDPDAGWKGRGIWTTSGSRTPFHAEGGTEQVAPVFKFQVRPDPLAH
ncbi:MAG: carboxypeptidase-like regulatory domain-containing protein [Acidobacteriota bacterium]|nr:carboxypeptidase-like regulatory domain-containing protein [Acidobacteriota bacterium]